MQVVLIAALKGLLMLITYFQIFSKENVIYKSHGLIAVARHAKDATLTWFFILLWFRLCLYLLLTEFLHLYQQTEQPSTDRVIHFFLLSFFFNVNT